MLMTAKMNFLACVPYNEFIVNLVGAVQDGMLVTSEPFQYT
jgi:hypothetical protein